MTNANGPRALITVRNAAALVAIDDNAPHALDLRGWTAALGQWARDPQIYAQVIEASATSVDAPNKEPRPTAIEACVDTARLCWQLECFSKPTVSLIDRPIDGFWAGTIVWGTHRVAGPNFRWRANICDVHAGTGQATGQAYTLARMPAGVGAFLALTGRAIGPADALRLGIATHTIAPGAYSTIAAALANAEPVDPLLDDRQLALPHCDLEAIEPDLASIFAVTSVVEIARQTRAVGERGAAWTGDLLSAIDKRGALGTEILLAAIARAGSQDIRATLLDDVKLALAVAGRVPMTPRVFDETRVSDHLPDFALAPRDQMQSLRQI